MHDSPEHGGDEDDLGTPLAPEIDAYYSRGIEAERLTSTPAGRLEFVRTQELLLRYLPPAPAVILDVGGGAGAYACWLATLGYEVHLVDPVALHVQQAAAAAARQPEHPLASATVGDARHLMAPNGFADAVLLLGPLYHIPNYDERALALKEAHRVLRPGGYAFVAAISRYASALYGLREGSFDDATYGQIVAQDLQDGQHRSPKGATRDYFTTAFLHQPADLRREIALAGLVHQATIAIEGPAWLLGRLPAYFESPEATERLMTTLRAIESEPSLLGASSHLLAIGQRAG